MGKKLVVLDNSLYKELHNFRNKGEAFNQNLISRIHRYAGDEILTNIKQIEDCDLKINAEFKKQLLQKGNKSATLEELAKATVFKLILTEDESKTRFPYVNINDDLIQPVLGGFFKSRVSRDKGISHMKALCSKGREFIIYDSYLSIKGKEQAIASILNEILPSGRKITIIYQAKAGNKEAHFSEELKSAMNGNVDKNYTFEDKLLPEHHDRYIIIDGKLEIIITSGFDYLQNLSKEVSYILRPYAPDNRFG